MAKTNPISSTVKQNNKQDASKTKQNNKQDASKTKQNNEQNAPTQGKMDRILFLAGSAVNQLKILTDSVDNLTKTVDRRKTTNAENAVKASKAETDAKKEEYRHNEEMAKIELEYKKISEASANGEFRWSMIKDMVGMIKSEYDKLNSMDDNVYLSEESRKSRDELRKTILDLSREIIKA